MINLSQHQWMGCMNSTHGFVWPVPLTRDCEQGAGLGGCSMHILGCCESEAAGKTIPTFSVLHVPAQEVTAKELLGKTQALARVQESAE